MLLHKPGKDLRPAPHQGHWLRRQYLCPRCDALIEVEEADVGAHPDLAVHSDVRATLACPHCRGAIQIERRIAPPSNRYLARHPDTVAVVGPWPDGREFVAGEPDEYQHGGG